MIPEIIWRMRQKRIYLTFDDGPDPEITPALLDLLEVQGIKATFFIIGRKAECFPGIVKRMEADGHTIGNHTFTHKKLLWQPTAVIEKELVQTNAVIKQITGRTPVFFRPPHGRCGIRALREIKNTGFKLVLWNYSSHDYRVGATAKTIHHRLLHCTGAGKIILLHDGHINSAAMLAALVASLDTLQNRGLQFAALPEL